jgi:nucleoside 2-deoxyribosyltransferase
VISEVFVKDVLVLGGSPLTNPEIYHRDILMIQTADAIIAEVTNPSLGVGYELAYGETLNKPILCLFNSESGGRLSAMVSGNSYNNISEYSKNDNLSLQISDFLTTL